MYCLSKKLNKVLIVFTPNVTLFFFLFFFFSVFFFFFKLLWTNLRFKKYTSAKWAVLAT